MASLNPRDWFRSKSREVGEVKASSAGPAIAAFQVGQPVWTGRDYEKLADEGYVKNAIAYRCVSMVAQAVGSVPLLLKDGGDQDIREGHPLLDLLNNPAPGHTGPEVMESVASFIQLSGNAYLEAIGPARGQEPRELWSLRPDRMKVIPDREAMPRGYEYTANGRTIRWYADRATGRTIRWQGDRANPGASILHLKRFHPTDDWYGLPATDPAAYGVDRHNEAAAHNMAVLQNSATPSGAMVFKPVKGEQGEGDASAPPEVIKAAQESLGKRYQGSANAGKPMVLGGNVDWLSFGMTMEQLQLNESKLDAARDICLAYGVPIEMLLPGDSTYNNKREAKLGLYEETVLPLAEHIVSHLNGWLAPRFGDQLKLEPDLDEIEALSLRREIRQENTLKLYEGGVIDRNEAREALQYEPDNETVRASVDASVITALVQSVSVTGYDPLIRYMKSVGLYDAGMSNDDILARAVEQIPSQEELEAALPPRRGSEGSEDA